MDGHDVTCRGRGCKDEEVDFVVFCGEVFQELGRSEDEIMAREIQGPDLGHVARDIAI